VNKIWLKQDDFCKIRLAEENFRLISRLTEFYETNKIPLNQAKYIHLPTTNLTMKLKMSSEILVYDIKREMCIAG